MKTIFTAVAALLCWSSVDAAQLVLKVSNKWTRECGKITQVVNSNSDSVLVSSVTCTCNLMRRMSVSDTMELVRADDRLRLTCEAENLDVGDQFSIEHGITASLETSKFSIQTVAR